MPRPRTAPGDASNVSRREFLTKRLPGRISGMLGGGAAAVPSPPPAKGGLSDRAGSFSPRDLTRMSRDDMNAALIRIRAQGKKR